MRRSGFTLVELLVVVGIVAVLVALIFPVFARARAKARQTACISNLRQIGMSIEMYAMDYDDLYPFAVDPTDRYTPEIWWEYPHWQALIPQMPMLHEVLQPYQKSREIWRCPADTGMEVQDFTGVPFPAHPSLYERYGTSYLFRTEIAFRQMRVGSIQNSAQVNLLFDGSGKWHGSKSLFRGEYPPDPNYRYNCLFADLHVKNVTLDQMWQAWNTEL
ncbi:MAG: prepilin-type N-terminal cleavage/methylation domain-containing protein [Armatimonadota bacterium]|nr:prepilin-type N-terminal cleavage/methylation domain-containing protein [Armatimonadota bacterium]